MTFTIQPDTCIREGDVCLGDTDTGGDGDPGTFTTGPDYGGRSGAGGEADGVSVEESLAVALDTVGAQVLDLSLANVGMSEAVAVGTQTAKVDGLSQGETMMRDVNKVTYIDGGNAVAEEDTVNNGWQDDANATGVSDGAVATLDGQVAQANAGTLVLSYADGGTLQTNGYQQTSVILKFYAASTGTALNNGQLEFRWRFNGGGWNTLATYTDDQDFLTTPDEYDITENIHDWAGSNGFNNIETGVFARADLGEELIEYQLDAVEVEVKARVVAKPVIDIDTFGNGTSAFFHVDAMKFHQMFKDSGKTLAAHEDGDAVERYVDLTGAGDWEEFSSGDTNISHDSIGPMSSLLPGGFRIALNYTGDYTIFYVSKTTGERLNSFFSVNTSLTGDPKAFEIDSDNSIPRQQKVFFRNNADTADVEIDLGDALDIGPFDVICVRGDTNGVEAYVNGVSQGALSDPTQGKFGISRISLNGFFCEAFGYQESLTDTEIADLSQLLERKWGALIHAL